MKCPRCKSENQMLFVTMGLVGCEYCKQEYPKGVPRDFNEEDERVYQVKKGRDD